MKPLISKTALGLLCFSMINLVAAADKLDSGANTFNERCVICHGAEGFGDGVLSLSIEDYPNTNLRLRENPLAVGVIEDIVLNGGGANKHSVYSPPWKKELSLEDIKAVSEFVHHLQSDPESAVTFLERNRSLDDHLTGEAVYKTRCAICHGPSGLGDGKMSKIIKSPPPFNLTYSVMPDDYLKSIILGGGASMGRSPKMPPWQGELTDKELEEVIAYIKSLRIKKPIASSR